MDALPWPILGALLGLVAGSFLATLVLRWPRGEALTGRSHCDACGVVLGPLQLVPILSFLWQRGRCRACGAAIDPRHLAIELAAGLVGGLALVAVPGPAGLAGALLGWILLACLALDSAHFWLPDALTLPLLGLGLLLGPAPLPDRLLAGAIGGGGLLLLALGYRWLRGRDGLGMGDVKLMAALGTWLSPAFLPPLLLVAALVGLAFAGIRAMRGKPAGAGEPIPFGACLAVAGFPLWLVLAGSPG